VFSMRLGIFAATGSPYARLLCAAAAERGHETLLLDFESLTATVRGGRLDWQCSGHDLRTLDAAVVRTMPPGTLEQVVSRMDLLAGLEAVGVPIINPPRALECAVDKYLTTQRLALAGVPVPDTVVCESAEAAMAAWEQLGGDVVVKPLFGAEGRGILRLSDRELAQRAFRTLERLGAVLYLQEFLKGPRYDLRLLLLDGQLLGAMQRIPRDGDFRANLSQQGSAVPWQPTPEELFLARRAAEITGAIFAGVDLMHREDLQPVVIEVNAVPGWKGLEQTCRVPVATVLVDWIEKKRARSSDHSTLS
jgi:RimK family alpha-L-glutamate ligase